MAEKTTIARPYAQAVFETARAQDTLAAWSGVLAAAAEVVAHPDLARLIDHPRVPRGQTAELVIEACGDRMDDHARNLIRVLADNHRLALLPDIARLYEEARAEAEGAVEAEVVSAQPLDEAQQQKLAAALSKRLGRQVTLRCETDEALLGGAVVRAGDLVIDGSAMARLEQLGDELRH